MHIYKYSCIYNYINMYTQFYLCISKYLSIHFMFTYRIGKESSSGQKHSSGPRSEEGLLYGSAGWLRVTEVRVKDYGLRVGTD